MFCPELLVAPWPEAPLMVWELFLLLIRQVWTSEELCVVLNSVVVSALASKTRGLGSSPSTGQNFSLSILQLANRGHCSEN